MNRRLVWLGVFLCFVFSGEGFAQVNSSIGGTVEDPSKALIPGVTITATNTGTGVVNTTITNESGVYNFAALIPGAYKVTAELTGFRTHAYKRRRGEASSGATIRTSPSRIRSVRRREQVKRRIPQRSLVL